MSDTEPEPARELCVADMRKVMASILDVLECPICYQELYSPIYQCNNGHPVCSNCRPRVRACPVCKSWMYHVRALTLEKIVREMPRPCRYTVGGCTERLGAATRAQHERCCPRRPARCVEALVSCGWKGPLVEARAHLWAEHQLAGRLHRAMHGRFSFSVGCVGQEKFLEDTAESVMFRCLIRADRGKLHFLCHALAAADKADMYVFRVLVTTRCSERRLSYEGPVPSVFQSVAKTIEASQGLRVGRDWLLKACSCRAGELCFDTTWQLSRRSELAQAERDLRTILAGAYPEPHGGSLDQPAHATPCRMRPEARTFTPSRSRQETPSVTPSSSRAEPRNNYQEQTPNASSPPHQDDDREENAALPSTQQESNANAGEQLSNSAQAECQGAPGASPSTLEGAPDVSPSTPEESPNASPSTSEGEPSASPCTSEGEPGVSPSTSEGSPDASPSASEGGHGDSVSTIEGNFNVSTGTPEGNPDAPTSLPEEEPDAPTSPPEVEPDAPTRTPEESSVQPPAAARLPIVSEVSAACYAAAVARLAADITSRLTGAASSDTETASSQPETVASQPETAASQRETATPLPETAASQPGTAASQPETTSSQPETGQPETAASQSDAVLRVRDACQSDAVVEMAAAQFKAVADPPEAPTDAQPTPEAVADPPEAPTDARPLPEIGTFPSKTTTS